MADLFPALLIILPWRFLQTLVWSTSRKHNCE